MTGSALLAVDVVFRLPLGENLLEMGWGPGGGGQKNRPEPRDADFFGAPKQSSHAGKTHLQVFTFSRTTFYSHGAHFPIRIALPCWQNCYFHVC